MAPVSARAAPGRVSLRGWGASVDMGAVQLHVVAEAGCHAVNVKAMVRLILPLWRRESLRLAKPTTPKTHPRLHELNCLQVGPCFVTHTYIHTYMLSQTLDQAAANLSGGGDTAAVLVERISCASCMNAGGGGCCPPSFTFESEFTCNKGLTSETGGVSPRLSALCLIFSCHVCPVSQREVFN